MNAAAFHIVSIPRFPTANTLINWQKSRSGASGEEFADMGIGWVYDQWEVSDTGVGWSNDGQARADFMNVNMAMWLNELVP